MEMFRICLSSLSHPCLPEISKISLLSERNHATVLGTSKSVSCEQDVVISKETSRECSIATTTCNNMQQQAHWHETLDSAQMNAS